MSAAVINWINKQKERKTTTTSQGDNNTTSIGVAMTADPRQKSGQKSPL